MDGIIAIVVLVLLAVFIIPIMIASSTNSKISSLQNDITGIKNYLKKIKEDLELTTYQKSTTHNDALLQSILKKIDELHIQQPQTVAPAPAEDIPLKELPVEEVKTQDAAPEIISEKPVEELAPQEEVQLAPETIEAPQEAINDLPEAPEAYYEEKYELLAEAKATLVAQTVEEAAAAKSKPAVPSVPDAPSKRTNFEQFIGEKLISIVGITILVLGIFFSVKWAIDRHLISDAGKIMIGIISGTLLIGVAHRLSKNYRAFSSILVGGGISVLYFSIYEAYQAYHLLPQAAAFGIMVVITLLTVILSIIYDKKELAIIAIVGGFGTPFFVSNGAGNYKILFSYLLILNIGMFLLANFKKWNLVNIICYALTLIIFGAWSATDFNETLDHASFAFLFSSLFFLVFFGMHIVYNLKHQKAFGYGEIILLLSNSLVYLGFGLYFLSFIQAGKYQGMFTLGLALFNFIFAYVFYRRKNIDKNLVYLLIGMVLTFLSLTGPLQLDGNYITLFWACELIVMYWMGTKTGISLLKNASILILILTLISLIMDWNNNYYSVQISRMTVIANKAFVTAAVVALSIFLYKKIIRKDKEKTILYGSVQLAQYNQLLTALLIVLVYASLFLEVQYQTFALTQNGMFKNMMLWNYHMAFVLALAFAASKKGNASYFNIALIVLTGSVLLYPISVPGVISLRNAGLLSGHLGLYYGHFLMPVLICTSVLFIARFISNKYRKTDRLFTTMAWLATVIVVFTLSVEVVHIWVTQSFSTGFAIGDYATKADKVALPIIWSICSLSLMLMGMRGRIKILRIVSLSLFSLTILKLFIYDISNVGQGGKIAAFIILGIILLIVSFMYQKIKGLFVDEESSNNTNPPV